MNAPEGPTKDELYERAQELDIEGRSEMTKDELQSALDAAEGSTDADAAPLAPSPLRPAQDATNAKTADAPGRADQPGLGRASVAERDPAAGPRRNVSSSRIGEAIERRKALREESVSG